MTVSKAADGGALTLTIAGRLDANTAPLLEAEMSGSLDGVADLTLDFGALEYISSAGLRVLLAAHKRMTKQGGMRLVQVRGAVMDVLDMTGFSDILTIE